MDDRSLKLSNAKKKLQKFQKHRDKTLEKVQESNRSSFSNSDIASLPNSLYDKSDEDSNAPGVHDSSPVRQPTPSQDVTKFNINQISIPTSDIDKCGDRISSVDPQIVRGILDRMDQVAIKKVTSQQTSAASSSWFSLSNFKTPSIWRTQPSFPQPVDDGSQESLADPNDLNDSVKENEDQSASIEYLNKEIYILRESVTLVSSEKDKYYECVQTLQKEMEEKNQELLAVNAALAECKKENSHLHNDLTVLQSTSQRSERDATRVNHEINTLKLTVEHLRSKNSEFESELREMRTRLKQSHSQVTTLTQENTKLTKDLEMTQIRLVQMTEINSIDKSVDTINESTDDPLTLLPQLDGSKNCSDSLLVSDLRATIDELEAKQREMMTDWRKHSDLLQRELDEKNCQLVQLNEEKDSLWERCVLLEEELEHVQKRHSDDGSSISSVVEDGDDPVDITSTLKESTPEENVENESQLKTVEENTRTQQSCAQCLQWHNLVENLQSRLWESQCTQQQLSDQLTILQETTAARDQLLLTVQGDKTALSRALTQNRQLKRLNEELESKFIDMSKDNMELTTQFQEAKYHEKEILQRLSEYEGKWNEICKMQNGTDQAVEISPSVGTTVAIQFCDYPDSLDADDHQGKHVDIKLSEMADDLINLPSTELFEVKQEIRREIDEIVHEVCDETIQLNNVNMTLEQLKLALYQLEAERDHLLKERKSQNVLVVELENLRREYKTLKRHYAQLEAENKRLEVEVMQLDGETNTIGEYVSLYRNQRDMLHQRARKWQQTSLRLIKEREQFYESIVQVEKLVFEKFGAIDVPPVNYNPEENSNEAPLLTAPCEVSEIEEDDASEIEAIVFSKEAPLEGHVVDLRVTTSKNCSNDVGIPLSLEPSSFQQENFNKLMTLVRDLKETCKPNLEVQELLSPILDSSSISSSTSSLLPSGSNANIPLMTRNSPSPARITALPSCRCCSGRLLML